MCLYVVAILSAVTLLASTDAALKDVSSKGAESTLPPSVRSGHGGVSTNRLLRVHENDEERAISFKSIPGVGKVTDAVTKAKLAKYLKSSRTSDEVFTKMKLGKAGEKLFENPKFLAWVKYVDDYNMQNPDKATMMIPTLTAHYSDDVLAKMLQQAMKVKGTEGIATRLQNQQLTTWKEMGLTSDDVFRGTLKLDKQTGNLFESPNFLVWTKYVDEVSGEKTSSFDFLWKAFGEEKLAKTLIAPKDARRNSVVAGLQNSLVRKWLAMSPPKQPFQVFNLLGPSTEGKVLSNLYRWNFRNQ